jgi:mxaK protein
MAGLKRWATALVWLLLAAALVAFGLAFLQWQSTRRINAMIRDRSIEKISPPPRDPKALYALAWNLERSQHLDEAAKTFIDVQTTDDPSLASNAWFALGNVYFESGVRISRESQQEGPRPELAQFELARDAYRSALRMDPYLYGARYNLELLERLAPVRPGEGWRRNTDPVKIEADRHNGWTTIREAKKRGLP